MSSQPCFRKSYSRQSLISKHVTQLTLPIALLFALAPHAGQSSSENIVADAPANTSHFQIAYYQCSEQFPPHVVSASIDFELARKACYVRLARSAMLNLPPNTPSLLYAALQAYPDTAESVFDEALTLGVEPYYAVTAATRALPLQDSQFARRAIAFGADPSRVTEATAAGHQIRPY